MKFNIGKWEGFTEQDFSALDLADEIFIVANRILAEKLLAALSATHYPDRDISVEFPSGSGISARPDSP